MKTDVIAELRARVAELEPLCAEKNGIIQRMGMRIKELEAEVLEQCRLI